jgi:hypothetical protein
VKREGEKQKDSRTGSEIEKMEVKFKKNYKPNARKKRVRRAVQAQERRITGSQDCGHVTSSLHFNHHIIVTIRVGNCGSGHLV